MVSGISAGVQFLHHVIKCDWKHVQSDMAKTVNADLDFVHDHFKGDTITQNLYMLDQKLARCNLNYSASTFFVVVRIRNLVIFEVFWSEISERTVSNRSDFDSDRRFGDYLRRSLDAGFKK